jgi:hypothetical protein
MGATHRVAPAEHGEHLMETLELPVIEETDDSSQWSDRPPVNFAEQEMDIAAFKLWREASRPDTTEESA